MLVCGLISTSYLQNVASSERLSSLRQLPRQFPYDNLYLERGGDPNKAPSPEDLKAKVRASYGGEVSS